jgi:hypothetical protein
MAVGRISGPLLAKNLLRDGVNLAFETNLLYLDVTTGRIGINTSSFVTVTQEFQRPLVDSSFRLDVIGTARFQQIVVDHTSTMYGSLFVDNFTNAEAYVHAGNNIASVLIAGGVAINKDVYIGGVLNVNSTSNFDSNIRVAGTSTFADVVTVTTTTDSLSTTTGALVVDGGVGIVKNVNIGGTFAVTGTSVFSSTATIISTTSATSVFTGALKVLGGAGVQGSVYSADGGTYENQLLYTPNIAISTGTVAPLNPRVGDFWIAPDIHAWMQYIQDGDQRIWVQITTL